MKHLNLDTNVYNMPSYYVIHDGWDECCSMIAACCTSETARRIVAHKNASQPGRYFIELSGHGEVITPDYV